jgi:PilZ domain
VVRVKFLLPRWGHLGLQARKRATRDLPEQRRAQRVLAAMPVLIYGRSVDEPFQEQTETIDVSAQGILMPITVEVMKSQKLLLTNLQTNQDLACRVARVVRTKEGRMLAGVEFLEPSEGFWGDCFPSTDGGTVARSQS